VAPAATAADCYSHKEHKAERHELVWGDYFALEGMLTLDGTVDLGGLQW
jgi:hypothetical protein